MEIQIYSDQLDTAYNIKLSEYNKGWIQNELRQRIGDKV